MHVHASPSPAAAGLLDRPPDAREAAAIGLALRQLLPPFEDGFLAAGERLAAALAELQGIETAFAELGSSLDSEALRHSIDALASVGDSLAALASMGQAQENSLRDLDAKARQLAAPLGRLRKTTDEVRVLAINSRVEAAHIDGAGTDFTVFTVEMGRLAEQAQAALERLGTELARLQDMTAAAEAAREGFDHLQGAAFDTVVRHVRAGVARLGTHRQGIASMAQSIGETSGRVGARVAEVIGALQIGDITRQRIEHVEQAIDAVGGETEQAIASVCALQSFQLEAAAEELGRDLARVGDNLGGLASDTEEVTRRSRELFGGDGGSLEGLGAELRKAAELSSRCQAAELELQGHLSPILQRLGEMLAHIDTIRSIEADMRLMGLNATLKCGRLGVKGRTLAVIAQVLRTHAGRTAEDAQQVMSGLAAIAHMARALSSDTVAVDSALHTTLEDAVGTFGHVERQFADARAVLERRAESASRNLLDCGHRLAPLREVHAGMVECAARLAGPGRGDGPALPGLPEAHSQIQQAYTMASERHVHARFLGTADGRDQAAQSLDDIFF